VAELTKKLKKEFSIQREVVYENGVRGFYLTVSVWDIIGVYTTYKKPYTAEVKYKENGAVVFTEVFDTDRKLVTEVWEKTGSNPSEKVVALSNINIFNPVYDFRTSKTNW
jgi:hypothetical protein